MNEEELIQRTRELIGRWDNVRIVGQGWAGDARRGFQFNPIRTVAPSVTAIQSCPTPVFISFSGITFDCGCTPFTPALASSFTIEDEGTVNTFVTTLTLGIRASPTCGDCLDGDGNGQFWEPPSLDFLPIIYIDFWSNTDCSGLPDFTHLPLVIFPVLILLSGTYYLFAFIQSTQTLIFYATASSLSGPFTNTLSCNPNYVTFSDPAITCWQSGGSYDFNVIAHGGNATVTS